MENASDSKINNSLNLDYKDKSGLWVSNGYTLRKLIGILGMSLPVLLWLYLYIVSNLDIPLETISHYYYTRAGSIFTITVSLLAIFLIVYKGVEPIDFYISSIAGAFAFCVVLFPTSNLCRTCAVIAKRYCITVIPESEFRETFHYISAGIFLLLLAYMSLFLFTKSNKPVRSRSLNKIIRNRIYRICGVIMVIAIIIIFLGEFLNLISPEFYRNNQITFWMETLAVEAFGFSWLIKGETLFKD